SSGSQTTTASGKCSIASTRRATEPVASLGSILSRRPVQKIRRRGAPVKQRSRDADVILWRRLDLPGHEVGSLTRRRGVRAIWGGRVFPPVPSVHHVICAGDWRTRRRLCDGGVPSGRRRGTLAGFPFRRSGSWHGYPSFRAARHVWVVRAVT